MKKILVLLVFAAFSYGIQAQGVVSAGNPKQEVLTLKETQFDFGQIQQGRPVIHEFEVINSGADSLKLENVQASCGCTTPVWKKDPVAPAAATKIQVGYNAAAEGPFEKLVTIFYNGGQTKAITIKGNVYKGPATSVPQNSSIELLKQTN